MYDSSTFKHNAAQLEATKGILLFMCMGCGSHQRREPAGAAQVPVPDTCFSCGDNRWEYDREAVQILRLQGDLGHWEKVKATFLEIRTDITIAFLDLRDAVLNAWKGMRES